MVKTPMAQGTVSAGEPVRIDSPQGTVRGERIDAPRGGRVCRFLGIPYAEPLRGRSRWQAPVTKESLPDDYPALQAGAVASQPINANAIPGLWGAYSHLPAPIGDDCLSLNVWSPEAACKGDGSGRPVMVWVHGGGWLIGAGSASLYAGEQLAAVEDVVVVTLNYRLGAFGFSPLARMSDGAMPGTGCEGILDQIEALRWARGGGSGVAVLCGAQLDDRRSALNARHTVCGPADSAHPGCRRGAGNPGHPSPPQDTGAHGSPRPPDPSPSDR